MVKKLIRNLLDAIFIEFSITGEFIQGFKTYNTGK